jgi:hypothetical protein
VFSELSSIPINYNAGFQFAWLGAFVVFFLSAADGHSRYMIRTLLIYSTFYVIFYDIAVIAFKLDLPSSTFWDNLVSEDPERGKRLFCYTVACAFSWFNWIYEYGKNKNRIFSGIMILLSGLAIYFALSRFITLIIVILTIAYLGKFSIKSIAKICLLALFIFSVVNLYGVFNNSWNPFALFAGDSSGSFRIWEYEVARVLIQENPILGIGIPPSADAAWKFVNEDFFAASDLGVIGIWFDLGLIGLIAFTIGSYIASQTVVYDLNKTSVPLSLTGCLMAAYGCIAPVILYPAGVTFFTVILGIWINNQICLKHYRQNLKN